MPSKEKGEPADTERVAEVERAILEAIGTVKDVDGGPPGPEVALRDLGLTSLEVVSVAFELEDRFAIEIRDRYLDDFRTLGEARDTVLALLRERDG